MGYDEFIRDVSKQIQYEELVNVLAECVKNEAQGSDEISTATESFMGRLTEEVEERVKKIYPITRVRVRATMEFLVTCKDEYDPIELFSEMEVNLYPPGWADNDSDMDLKLLEKGVPVVLGDCDEGGKLLKPATVVETSNVRGSNLDYPVEDWQHEVAEGLTRLGYWQWVADQINGFPSQDNDL